VTGYWGQALLQSHVSAMNPLVACNGVF
jgi:hypothetical protein